MRFLKNKILEAQRVREANLLAKPILISEVKPSAEIPFLKVEETSSVKTKATSRKSSQTSPSTPKDKSKPSSKNIVKNFGKAMVTFANSKMSLPIIEELNSTFEHPVDIPTFQEFIRKQRDSIDSIDSVRKLLFVYSSDSEEMINYKKLFQATSVVFIKFYSVNWIFQGKMSHKQAHLQSRHKMLRRVKSPEYFTYFKEFSK